MDMLNLSAERAEVLLKECKGKAIAVVGDVMLDRFFWGSVSRISPEAPVPVVDVEKESYHLGGAANVASNLKSLGLTPLMCGVIGDDATGRLFKDISEKAGMVTDGLFACTDRPTTVKTRIIGDNQHIVRLDIEVREPVKTDVEKHIINVLNNQKDLSGIIFEDYNKGLISNSIIESILALAKKKAIPVYVDPKFEYFFDYKGVSVFKPNRKEAQQALNLKIKTKDEVEKAGKLLLEKLDCENVLITLGSEGMMLFERNGSISSVPTRARNIADVSGAGDTAIATLAAAYSSGATIKESATLANYASGIVCESPGIVSITPEEILYSVKHNNN